VGEAMLEVVVHIAFWLFALGFTIAGIGYFRVGNIGGGIVALLFGLPNLAFLLLGTVLELLGTTL